MSASVGTGFLTWLFPRFDAAVSPEFYRQSGKLRALTNLVFLVSNLVIAPRVDSLGFEPSVHWRVVVAYSCIHTLDGALALWLWRGRNTLRGMRVLTFVGVVLEALAVVAAAWVYGSVNSPFLGIELVVLVVYRFWFDFRVGFVAFVLTLVGQWLVVVLEITGALPSQPMAGSSVDKVYLIPSREIGAMLYLTFVYVLTFAVVNWSVGRMRHKDVAIRLLREQLFADKGKLGRHTGRTLRDTYALGGLLGSGGMGEVYTATHLRTQRRVAVKMLHTHLVEDRTVLSRFRREAAVTGQLGSEHIVGVIDVDEDEGQPYIVLELVDGISLEARIRGQGALSFGLVADVVDQIARGLDVAHKAGVIHRDLKPENVLLCDRSEGGLVVKILDFGVSKIHGSATAITQEAAMLGTPDFMSPEQAQGNADTVEASSDVFALGGVAYTCITGQRPFRAESVPAVLRRICEQEPPPIATLRADVPPAVADVIAIAIAKSPSDRYASTTELARDLRAALAGQLDPAVTERAARISRGRPSEQRLESPKQIDATGETQPT